MSPAMSAKSISLTSLFHQQLAWLVAFISSVISEIKSPYPHFAWWAVAYMLCCIVGILVVVASASQDTYQVAVRLQTPSNQNTTTITDTHNPDCWIPRPRSRLHLLSRQHPRLLSPARTRSGSSRFHPPLHDRRTYSFLSPIPPFPLISHPLNPHH